MPRPTWRQVFLRGRLLFRISTTFALALRNLSETPSLEKLLIGPQVRSGLHAQSARHRRTSHDKRIIRRQGISLAAGSALTASWTIQPSAQQYAASLLCRWAAPLARWRLLSAPARQERPDPSPARSGRDE
jgi:hypothetical protein